MKAARRSISARTRCLEWFTKTGVNNAYSVPGHAQFINVLENVLSILAPWIEPPKPPTTISRQKDGVVGDRTHDVTNLFTALSVDYGEVNVDDLDEFTTPPSKHPSAKTPVVTVEVESDPIAEIGLIVYLFFEDLNKIREYLNELWTKFAKQEIDLLTATVITNAAIGMISAAEKRIIDDALKELYIDATYFSLAKVIFSEDAITRIEDPLRIFHPDFGTNDPFSNFLLLPTASTLSFAKYAKELGGNLGYVTCWRVCMSN